MDAFRQYVISVTSAAIICSVVMSLVKKGPPKELVSMVCGLFLVCTLLSPLPTIDLEFEKGMITGAIAQGKEIANISHQNAKETYCAIIKSELESYIYAKAESMNLEIDVRVSLMENDIHKPESVTISGTVPPYSKLQLEHCIISELGITKENLHWIG